MVSVAPSPRLVWLFAGGLPIALGGAIIGGLEWLIVPYDIVLILAYWLTSRLAKREAPLSASRSTDSVLSVGVENRVELTVSNRSARALKFDLLDPEPFGSRSAFKEHRVSLQPDATHTTAYNLTPEDRGTLEFESVYVRHLAPIGLAMVTRQLPCQSSVAVYPNVKAVRSFELLRRRGQLQQMGIRKSRIRGLGTDFESLRDYNEDDYRFIDWNGTARRGRLVVRQYEQERNQSVIVCLDAGRHMLGEIQGRTKLDHVLDAALMLIHAAEREGDHVGIMVFADQVQSYVSPKKGRAHAAAVIEALHDVQPEATESDYAGAFGFLGNRWKRRSLIVVFTDAEDEDQGMALAESLAPVRGRHVLVLVRVSDPGLKERLNLPVTSPDSLLLRASAVWYQTDRLKAETVLRRSRFRTLVAEPRDLAAVLVSTYGDVKRLALV